VSTYQNIVIDDIDCGASKGRRYSKFYNKGRWDNYIAPHLPDDCSDMTFMDVGCNGGLFLKLAKEKGFRNLVGIEKDAEACKIAKAYLGNDAEIINQPLDESLYKINRYYNKLDFLDKLPAVDFLLFSNVHYHLFTPVFLHFLNIMRRKTRYIIVVSARIKTGRYRPHYNKENLDKYFKLWKEVGYIEPLTCAGDPTPRVMFSVLYKSDLERIPIDNIILDDYSKKFYEKVDRLNKNVDFPFTYPILLKSSFHMVDGTHRLVSLKRKGYKSTIVEML